MVYFIFVDFILGLCTQNCFAELSFIFNILINKNHAGEGNKFDDRKKKNLNSFLKYD